MVLVGAVILPHGPMTFDGNPDSFSEACRKRHANLPGDLKGKCSQLYQGCIEAGQKLAALKPDLVILHTSHGISLSKSVGVYSNNVAEGNACWNDQWADIKVSLPLDVERSQKLIQHLCADNIETQGILGFSNTSMPLGWGEVVPTWYIQNSLDSDAKYIIISEKQQKKSESAMEESLEIGASLVSFIKNLDERVVLAIGGDLAHTFHTTCQDSLYLPDPRWDFLTVNDEAAHAFKRAIQSWVLGDSDTQLSTTVVKWTPSQVLHWLQDAHDLQPNAQSCGIVGFTILQGALQSLVEGSSHYWSQIHCLCEPTYYGMMAATFIPANK